MTLFSAPVRFSLLLTLLSLSACSLTPPKSMMDVQAGYTFTLKKPVTVPAHDARAFIQDGQMTTHHGFNRYEQHCELEVKDLSRKPQVIQPGTFTITKVRIDSEAIASRQAPTVFYAMNDINPYPNQTLRDLPTTSTWPTMTVATALRRPWIWFTSTSSRKPSPIFCA